jgi:putative aldouronate transport system substrate-binding protein
MRKPRTIIALALAAAMALAAFAGCTTAVPASGDGPLQFTVVYSDNPTLPFKQDWLTVQTANELFNLDVTWELVPTADWGTKVPAELSTGTSYDVFLYLTPTTAQYADIALNGGIVPVSDLVEQGWMPNFERLMNDWGLSEAVDTYRLSDGKYYFAPSLYDKQFYDGGLIIREDLLEKFGMDAPTNYDEFYEYLKACKDDNPESYPLTYLVGPRVYYRMAMPSWGISLGENAATGSWVLSYDYDNAEYFPGAISDEYKAFLEYHAKLYAEGLLDPEFVPQGDMWAIKMATGAATATYAYYDQIGGVHASSEIEGIKLNLIPPLEGIGGAHHQEKSRVGSGIVFSAAAAERDDFEQVVRAVDEMFYSDAGSDLWCLGVEGETYDIVDGKVVFKDELVNSADGIYKTLQVQYGAGSASSQFVWINEREMLKYDENYAAINAAVAGMDEAIRAIPPAPVFDDVQAEEANLYRAALRDAFDIWANDFLTGAKSLETDWDAYVAEMTEKGILDMCQIYNDARR